MTTLVQTISLNKITSLRLPRVNWRIFLMFSFCAMIFLSVLYVFQINRTIRDGYLIKGYQDQMSNLVKENKNLEVNLAQISYSENIQNKAKELSFEKVGKIKYIQILDNSLAKK